ncbi:hypothetical protein ETAA8_08550 [Anatilimnocola aggregata]|uniref:Uncharacterized protein n=1 Tax=Anatilimnocola aggregata TaxID=2528021 RepID=A0A517Y6C0_9BACT|nr:hypothetical protein [Anatilimnocola aggregata]QDU25784.1 hypothetical protein ETAA8_08550 [Anatilimnocola aggregata]
MRFLLLFTLVAFGAVSLRGEDPPPRLELKIAVPVHHHHRSLNTDGDHFHVLVKNVSDQPIRLWTDRYAWGYDNLSFEEIAADGTATPIKKKARDWAKNVPDWLELKPGDTYVLNVNFSARDIWENPPQAKPGAKPTKLKLRGVYQTNPDRESVTHGVWTGKLESAVDTYSIW